MKKLFILILVIGAGQFAWKKYSHEFTRTDPLYTEPYVVVYGRNSCGFTRKTMKDLKQAGITYIYKSVDDRAEADILHSRMEESGLEIRRYNLPVVDVNNNISVRPDSSSIVTQYRNGLVY